MWSSRSPGFAAGLAGLPLALEPELGAGLHPGRHLGLDFAPRFPFQDAAAAVEGLFQGHGQGVVEVAAVAGPGLVAELRPGLAPGVEKRPAPPNSVSKKLEKWPSWPSPPNISEKSSGVTVR